MSEPELPNHPEPTGSRADDPIAYLRPTSNRRPPVDDPIANLRPVPSGAANDPVAYFRSRTGRAEPWVPFKRPGLVTFLAVVFVIFGVIGVSTALGLVLKANTVIGEGYSLPLWLMLLIYGQVAFAAAEPVAGIFIRAGRSWARTLGIVLCSLKILLTGLGLLETRSLLDLGGIAVHVGLLWLLTRNDVRAWCVR